MTVIVFNLFYLVHMLIGRGLVLFLKNKLKFKVEFNNLQISEFNIYPIVAIFLFGNLSFIANFFVPVLDIIPYLIGIAIFFIIYNLKEKVTFQYPLQPIVTIIISSILSISTFGMRLHYDMGLYHLVNQTWIRENKIVFGIQNLHNRLGFSSIQEYISSIYWYGGNYVFLHFLNLIFFVFFFIYLYETIFIYKSKFLQNSSIIILLYCFMDNFGVNGGGNGFVAIQTIGKSDSSFAVIYFITSLLILNELKNKNFSYSMLSIFLYMTFFAIQFRVSGVVLLVLIFFYFFNDKNINFLNIFKTNKTLLSISFLWLIKNIIISGCAFFPIKYTCVTSLNWYSKELVDLSVEQSRGFYKAIDFKNLQDWFSIWLNTGFNRQITYNFLISILLIFLIRLFITIKNIDNQKISLSFFIFLILGVLLWLTNSPGLRFAYALYMLCFIPLSFNREIRGDVKYLKVFILMLFSISILLFPRLYSYQHFLNNYSELTSVNIPVDSVEVNQLNWGVSPINGDQCWNYKECSSSNKGIQPLIKYDYYFFYSLENK